MAEPRVNLTYRPVWKLYQRLKQHAENEEKSMNQVINAAVRKHLAKEGKNED